MFRKKELNKQHLPAKYSWLILGLTTALVGIFLLILAVPNSFGGSSDNMFGWAWSPVITGPYSGIYSGYGLTSFNDCYCIYGDPPGSSPLCFGGEQCFSDMGLGYSPYGLSINLDTKEIYGWAWSANVGWICFGSSCENAGGGQNYNTGLPTVAENPNLDITYDDSQVPAPLTGWAKIIGFPDDKGWLSLYGNVGGTDPYGLYFSSSTMAISGLAWNGFLDPGKSASMPNDKGYGWFCIGTENTAGYGDLCGDTEVRISMPFLQTVDGDVYVRSDISFDYPPNIGSYNATYLVLSGGSITNFVSEQKYRTTVPAEQQVSDYLNPNYPYSVGLPRADQNYHSELGFLDVVGLSLEYDNAYGTWGGKYEGETVQNNGLSGCVVMDDSFAVNGDRIVIEGDLTLDNLTLDSDFSGVTVVVKGDLRVAHDIVVNYSSGAVNNFANLPSAAFIVEGDMFIDPSVERLAGNFVVLGDPSGPTAPPDGNPANATGYGAIYTGLKGTGGANDYCDNADYVFEKSDFVHNFPYSSPFLVCGLSCDSACLSQDRVGINITEAGNFKVYAEVERNNSNDPQPNEEFTFTINSTVSDNVLDRPCDIVTSTPYIGNFNFNLGENTVTMDSTAPACPTPADNPNSVEISKICLHKNAAGSEKSLTSYGIMMARKFFFQRKYSGALGAPAENIIYDGRLLVNPPPGFADLAESLPVFVPISPQ